MKTKTYVLKNGKLVETPMSSERLAKMREKASKRYSPDGEDLSFRRMMQRFNAESKRRRLQPA